MSEGELRQEASIAEILDKGSGALVLYTFTTYDNIRNTKLAKQQFSMFQKGYGNFAAIARMAEHDDHNPVHIDPEFCKKMGYDGTPLHGLVNFGICVKHILDNYSIDYSRKILRAQARFSNIVYPGQTIVTEMWEEGNRVLFQAKTKETGKVVITNAFVDFRL
uniref:MaoC-like domain-containing protein n=1 Tax=Acrobeloides nanus TaxID=290746 RepID=A0A914CHL1_9BILA